MIGVSTHVIKCKLLPDLNRRGEEDFETLVFRRLHFVGRPIYVHPLRSFKVCLQPTTNDDVPLHIPDPLSTTRAAISSSSSAMVESRF